MTEILHNEPLTASLRYAGKIVNLMCRVSCEHLSWQTNPSPKTRTAQTCGTLAVIVGRHPTLTINDNKK